ncbi:MAG: Stk1 family PASTA domain-containing Ser/Thr kinase, partial [Clostridia bacterium]|nr:Stk1 family PASTA domain-containing Ser/Thr kinase [Clostridia bacterium]
MDKYIGKRLDGRYEIKELIGVGGMAYVYLAYDTIDAREVAVKILKEEYLANEEFTRRFKNESKAIAILSHPNIVKVLDVSFGERIQYIVMEYIDGITLKEYIERQSVTWKEAVHFTVQILRALQHAHDKGIVHRDIKPQNIMLLADGTIKVTDFGIARFSRNAMRTGLGDKAIGSVHYISPEQARGAFTDEKADIYSVGVMLYEMLTGQLPFEADNAVSVAIMQLQSQPQKPSEINPDIPEGLEEITLKAMQKEPSKRYQSAAEMLQDIQEFKQNPSIRFEYTYLTDENPTRFVEAIASIKGDRAAAPVEEDEEEEESKFPLVPVLIAAASALVLVTLIILGVIGFSQGWFGGQKANTTFTVPNFVGRDYQTLSAEELKNFDDVQYNYEYNQEYAADVIIKQDPPANRSAKVGQKVLTLTLSKGPQTVELPKVDGTQKEEQIVRRLENAKLVVKTYPESSETVPEGFVIRIEPASEPVVEGTTVYVYVSTGLKEVDPVEVANVVGKDQAAAMKALNDQGFVVNENKIIKQNSDQKSGTVLAQSPAAGEKLKPGEEVILTVSSGYRDVEVTLPLPNIDDAVDLQVFVDGQYSDAHSANLKGLLPSDVGNKILVFDEARDDSYVVSVQIAFAGTGEYR